MSVIPGLRASFIDWNFFFPADPKDRLLVAAQSLFTTWCFFFSSRSVSNFLHKIFIVSVAFISRDSNVVGLGEYWDM